MKGVDLRTFRQVNHLEQKDVASYLGVSRQQISQIENGRSELTKENLRKLLGNPYGWDVSALPKDPMSPISGIVVNGNAVGSAISQDNRQYYSDSPDVLRAQIDLLDERLKEKDAQIKEKDAQIKEKDAQIKQLLDILQGRK